jgi:hypothetical protein
LNIRSITAAAAGKRNDVVVFDARSTATALTPSAISRKNDLFSSSGNITALGKTAEAEEKYREEYNKLFHTSSLEASHRPRRYA